MTRRGRDKVTVRVPNPKAPVKERLKVPSHKVHRSKKGYQRKGKHRTEWD
jgi:flagellar hook assembly protein FlgD